MTILFVCLFLFVAAGMIGLILLQEGKGGGLAGNAPGMDHIMGARNPLRRLTAWFFVAFVVLALGINTWLHRGLSRGMGDIDLPEGAVPMEGEGPGGQEGDGHDHDGPDTDGPDTDGPDTDGPDTDGDGGHDALDAPEAEAAGEGEAP